MAKKKPKIGSLKTKAWKLFSEIIRRKGADENGNTKCVTCGKVDHWKRMQAGHFIAGRTNSILFEESGVHVQCYRCNVGLSGNVVEYYEFMLKKYGKEEVARLKDLRSQIRKISIPEYEEIIQTYKKRLEELEVA